jgi:predicted AlkP superfamily phosphohydrolase/phosphomutase
MTKLLTIGIDGATWKIIKPNLDKLPNFKKLIEEGNSKSIFVKDDIVISAAVWCTIFSGKTTQEHDHRKFVVDNELQTRKDIKVDFVWDVLNKDYDVRVLQIPFIAPPYNFNADYEPVGYGVSSDLKELKEDTEKLFKKSIEILRENPEVFIVVFSALDRVQHFHWDEPLLIDWYKKIDEIIGELNKYGEKIIIVSDHGFCSRGEAKVQTLPDKNDKGEPLKGDHHEEAILITKNINHPIKEHKDIFSTIINSLKL